MKHYFYLALLLVGLSLSGCQSQKTSQSMQPTLTKADYGQLSDGQRADLYTLTVERLSELEGFGEISAQNLVRSLEASKEQPFERVLYGLGIPGVGYVNARNLARHLRSMETLVGASEEQLTEVEGIGPIMARTIAETVPNRSPMLLARAAS